MTHDPATPARLLRDVFADAVAAVHPDAVMTNLPIDPVGPPCWIIAVGKAADGMAASLAKALRAAGRQVDGGLVIGVTEQIAAAPPLERVVGDHPVPGARSRAASVALEALLARIPLDAEVHVALSGGATALMAAPRDGTSPEALTDAFSSLHRAGLPIAAMNNARRDLVRWGDGRLADALAPRPTLVWVISDVPGDDIATIGSGPCVTTTPHANVQHTIVASNALAIRAAANAAAQRHCVQRVSPAPLSGEAREAGRAVAIEAMRTAREWQQQNHALREDGHGDAIRPLVMIWGGESTVTQRDHVGLGGRAQEMALAAAEMLDVSPFPVTLLVAGTDGRDGPTDAAGALVDHGTWARLTVLGDPRAAIDGHDAYPLLDRAGALLRTGPTGTNVMDLVLAVVGWEDAQAED